MVDKKENKQEGKEQAGKIAGKEAKEQKQTGKQETDEKKNTELKAVVRGLGLRISPKDGKAICRVIKRKTPEQALDILNLAIIGKRAIPMRNQELPHHRFCQGGGRFPKKACMEIGQLVKQLKANAITNGIEEPIIFIAKTDKASRPFKREGRRAKRAHVYLEARRKG
ncbi:MAG: hypothetical protein ACP5D2_01160 [Candidatus Nanoarchaeia archaeon]